MTQLTNRQTITNNHNNNENNTILPDSQSNTILHKFSMMAEELKNFTKQVSSNITKMTQAHDTAQEHAVKLIENAISKTLSKTQDTNTSPPTTVNASTRSITYESPIYDLTANIKLASQPNLPYHTSHMLTLIQHIDARNHK